MFTGIITAIGTISDANQAQSGADAVSDLRLKITCPYDPASIDIGASIACSGVCLTVIERGGDAGNAWFAVDVSDETISRTVPGMWKSRQCLNLERALKVGDELGGHIVTGHVDGVGAVTSSKDANGSRVLGISVPAVIAPFMAAKGSVTIDGVSLTVNDVADNGDGSCEIMLNIIPHTAEVTTLGDLGVGDQVNLEIDTLARYLQRMQALRGDSLTAFASD